MHAVVFERNGGPDVLTYGDAPDPAPADGEVLVHVEAAGINYMDVYERMGKAGHGGARNGIRRGRAAQACCAEAGSSDVLIFRGRGRPPS